MFVGDNMSTRRKTQNERSAETRRQLHDATIASLADVGYANTSTTSIAKRAGLSRGAQTYHYQGKLELIVAATQDMFEGFSKDVEKLAISHSKLNSELDVFLDALWSQMRDGNWFYSSLEIIVASRGDAELHSRLSPLILHFHATIEEVWSRYFEVVPGSSLQPRVVLNLVMNVFRGMAVQAVLRRDVKYFGDMIETLNTMLSAHVGIRKSIIYQD